MAMVRWDPFSDLAAMQRMMDRMFSLTGAWAGERMSEIPIDFYEEGDDYVVRADLPGVRPQDIDIAFQGNTLTIQAKMEERREDQDRRRQYFLREHRVGAMSRAISLPGDVNAEEAEARFEHGVLEVRLPKRAEARARQIPVRAGGEGAPEPRIGSQTRPESMGAAEPGGVAREQRG